MDAKPAVHALVHAALLSALVDVEATARLAAQSARFDERRDTGTRRRLNVVAVGLLHHPGDFDGDIEPDLVEQCHRSHGESEAHRHAVDVFDRRALGEEVADFIAVGRENPVHPEARAVLYDNDCLSHSPAERYGGADRLGLGARAWDDLE